jgi:aromatic ring-opening dioxygenase catalytic subunit (LigB family)
MTTNKLPTLYLPHGGGPCFFMEWTMGPRDMWDKMAAYLRSIEKTLPQTPKALLVISAHWETQAPTVLAQEAPPLLFDYYGFPPHTYQLTWPAPGDPALAKRVQGLLAEAGISSAQDTSRGFDHGVFIPLKLAFSEAKIPTVQLSLKVGLDPAEHIAIGRALAPLREEGVLIIGSGMSYHNMRGFMNPSSLGPSQRFDAWLATTSTQERTQREQALTQWRLAPSAKECHPREEHLLPLMVVAGAANEDAGQVTFQDQVMGVVVSAIQFG